MSDVIRNAIIKLGIEISTPSVKSVDLGGIVAQQQNLAAATKASTAANQAAAQSAETLSSAYRKSVDPEEALINARQRLGEANSKLAAAEFQLASALEYEAQTGQRAFDHQILRDKVREQGIAVAKAAANVEAADAAAKDFNAGATDRLAVANMRLNAANARVISSAAGVARGFAMIAISQGGALSKTIPYLFALEGLTIIVQRLGALNRALATAHALQAAGAGTAAAANGILAASFARLNAALGPVGWAILAIGAAVGSIVAIYRHFVPSQEEVNNAIEQETKLLKEATARAAAFREQFAIGVDAQMQHAELIKNAGDKLQAYAAIANNVNVAPDQRLQAEKEIAKTLDESVKSLRDQQKYLTDIVDARQRDLQTAEKALQVEQDRDLSTRAAIGKLTGGEQRRLDRLTTKVEGGGTLTRKEAIDFEKLGGDAGKKFGEQALAQMDKGLGARLEKLIGNPLAAKQAEVEEKRASLNEITRGYEPEEVKSRIAEMTDAVVEGLEGFKDALIDHQNQLIDAIRDVKIEQNQSRTGARTFSHGASGSW